METTRLCPLCSAPREHLSPILILPYQLSRPPSGKLGVDSRKGELAFSLIVFFPNWVSSMMWYQSLMHNGLFLWFLSYLLLKYWVDSVYGEVFSEYYFVFLLTWKEKRECNGKEYNGNISKCLFCCISEIT